MTRFLGAIFILFSALLLVPSIIFAQSPRAISNEDVIVIPENETVEEDLFAASKRIEIFGDVNGDIFVAGGNINISGNVTGNAYVAGGEIDISGNIGGDTYIAGGQVTLSGTFNDTLNIASGNLQFAEEATATGPVSLAAGNGNISGSIEEDLNIATGNTTISGDINGDVTTATGELRVTPQTNIGGYLMIWSNSEISVDDNANISGEVIHNVYEPDADTRGFIPAFAALHLYWKLTSLISIFIIGYLLIRFFPVHATNTVQNLVQNPARSFGIGFLAIILIPLVVMALFASLIGIPLAMVITGIYLILIYVAKLPIILWLGGTLRKDETYNEILSLLFGTLIYFVLILLPFIGGVINLIAVIFGIGAMFTTSRMAYSSAKSKNII